MVRALPKRYARESTDKGLDKLIPWWPRNFFVNTFWECILHTMNRILTKLLQYRKSIKVRGTRYIRAYVGTEMWMERR